jgi:ABC-type cobalamin/Fe3+-siderophores transport system ATPase subunit
MTLALESVTAGYHKKAVVFDASLSLAAGEVLCLLGANGCGKTTLLKTALGLIRPLAGVVRIAGEDIARWPRARLARTLGYVPQAHTPPFAFRVRDVVLMARLVHSGVFAAPQARDYAIADEALDRLNMSAFADGLYTELSGGERQLVLIARALAQQARLLVLDEPTSNLDFSNQVRVLQHIRELAAAGFGAIVTTHYPDFAFLIATRAALMKQGRILAAGSVEETLTEAALQEAYGTPLRIADAGHGVRVVVPRLESWRTDED